MKLGGACRTELVSSVEDWTDQFLDYLEQYVWPRDQADQHTLGSNSTYFADKLTQFLFSFKGRNQRIYISDRTHSIPLRLPNMCLTQPLPALSVEYTTPTT